MIVSLFLDALLRISVWESWCVYRQCFGEILHVGVCVGVCVWCPSAHHLSFACFLALLVSPVHRYTVETEPTQSEGGSASQSRVDVNVSV